jgi:hypothetical protein
MSHYIAIFIEDHIGEWRVVFPDAPGCEAKGFTLHDARYAAPARYPDVFAKAARRHCPWIWRPWKSATTGWSKTTSTCPKPL